MASERPRLRFPRAMRLRGKREFDALRQKGDRHAVGCLIANWAALPAGEGSALGVIVSRRVGPATVRSRARRLLREVFRVHQHDLRQPVRAVLVARPSIAHRSFAEVEKDFLTWGRRAALFPKA